MLKRLILFFALAAFVISAAVASDYITILHFPDGSAEYCSTDGYTINYLTLDIQVVTCNVDEIFRNGFEPLQQRPERDR